MMSAAVVVAMTMTVAVIVVTGSGRGRLFAGTGVLQVTVLRQC